MVPPNYGWIPLVYCELQRVVSDAIPWGSIDDDVKSLKKRSKDATARRPLPQLDLNSSHWKFITFYHFVIPLLETVPEVIEAAKRTLT